MKQSPGENPSKAAPGRRTIHALVSHVALAGCCALLLAPKAVLLTYSEDVLLVPAHPRSVLSFVQDSALALLLWVVLFWLVRGAHPLRIALGFFLSGSILLLLMIDCRVRELWLQPLSPGVLRYAYDSRSDLASGVDMFLNHRAFLAMTMRKLLVILAAAHLAWWVLLYLLIRRRGLPGARWSFAIAGGGLLLLLLASALVPRATYNLERNILIHPVVSVFRSRPAPAPEAAAAFDQQSAPARSLLASPRVLAPNAAPFRNLVLILFESLRWKDMNIDPASTGPTETPVLRRLASDGILARSYVSLPHSSKSYYSIMTGRHPWPGLEMVESTRSVNESLFGQLRRAEPGMQCEAFSSMFLSFENLGGLLRSFGIDAARQVADDVVNSFGGPDDKLAESVSDLRAPFAAVYLPLAAHFPYDYPGKPPTQGPSEEAYLETVRRADAMIGGLLARLGEAGLLENTLVVIVGDHGESFGEHGTTIHNNSMYEEEITSPLIFWSADGRLRTPGVQWARHIDIAPTVLDLFAVLDSPLPVQGRSLLRQTEPGVVYVTSFFDGVAQARIEGTQKIIYSPDSGAISVFDLDTDPGELSPRTPVDPAEVARIKALFDSFTAYQRVQFSTE